MKEIKLTQGKIALVDDEDFERVNQFKWCAAYINHRNLFTALRTAKEGQIKKTIYMHRFIMNAKEINVQVDHINCNTLDNRKKNLRLCSSSENNRNTRKRKSNKSGYKGVFYHKLMQKFTAKICLNYHIISLGYFDSPIEAAKAYNTKALELHGEFARMNEI